MRPALLAATLLLLAPGARGADVVSFGKEVRRIEPVAGSLVVVAGSAVVDTLVERDVVVLGGDLTLGAGALVKGDVLVLGGALRGLRDEPRSLVKGELHTIPALEAAFLSEVETSPAAQRGAAGLLVSLRLALLALWLVIGSLLLLLAPRRVAGGIAALPTRSAVDAVLAAGLDALLGGVALLSGALLSGFFLAVLPAGIGIPVVGVVVVLLLAAKAFGLAVVSLAVGRRLTKGRERGTTFWGDPAALALGLLALGVVSLVPVAGRIVWMAASLVAIGVSVGTGFGRPLESGVPARAG